VAGPRWHKRRRTEDETSNSETDDSTSSDSESENDLKASRHWDRNESKKTAGCMADGLLCNMWSRAQSPGSTTLSLVKGLWRVKEARRGNMGLTMQDLAWTAASGRTKPTLLANYPLLSYLSNKIVHFLVDYHPDWIAQLGLPPTDGLHRQLETHHFHRALERLELMPDVLAPVQVFSAVNIGHKDWLGTQCVHSRPFSGEKSRMVCLCLCMNMYVYNVIWHVYCMYHALSVFICIYVTMLIPYSHRTTYSSSRRRPTFGGPVALSAHHLMSAGMAGWP
jgi:hypothetical protein